jgi:Protein of unknown function (DUF3726).|tara:strand:+ start:4695 stop:5411 length:717 start_codon:yes stop_codon:yes gene_type:complete
MGFCHNEFLLKFVSYSYYEVYTNTQRAFSGLGFSYGSDEDAAFITTWLELCGLNGVKLLNLKIKDLDNNFNANIDSSKINSDFDCNNKSTLMIGPGLIDFLISKVNNNINFKITMKNCDDPIFLIPLLYKYAKKNINSQIISSHKIQAQITNKNIAVNKEIISTTYQEDFDLLLTKNIINEQKLDIHIQSSKINEMLSNGINPDKKSWDQISDIAFRTFVPESEESRSKGAGGGDAND